MKLFNIFLVGVLSLSISILVFANGNNDKEHEFKAGVMKEIFTGIEEAKGAGGKLITRSELVGSWVCNAIAPSNIPSNYDGAWIPKGEGAEGGCLYYQYSGGMINFIDNGDGSFSMSMPNQDPCFLITTDETRISPCVIIGDTLYRICYYFAWGGWHETNVNFSIKKISANKIILRQLDNNYYASKVIVCDRVITP